MLVLAIMTSLSFVSCGPDDDDSVPTVSIIGTWVEEGSNSDYYRRLVFRADGTGALEEESGSSNLKYTFSVDSSTGKGSLKYWFINDSKIFNSTITITGNTMMLTEGSTTSIWNRR